jgi:phosphoserine aminotransferase
VAAASGGHPRAIPAAGRLADARGRGLSAFTPNETIDGIEFHWMCPRSTAPLVADMSSTLLSRPICRRSLRRHLRRCPEEHRSGGPDLLIVRRERSSGAPWACPAMLNWEPSTTPDSMLNTPPTYSPSTWPAWCSTGWKAQGGLEAMAERNRARRRRCMRRSTAATFTRIPVHPRPLVDERALHPGRPGTRRCGSWSEADPAGLLNLKGHRSVGGMRASIYNAMPQAGVDALIAFMREFERRCRPDGRGLNAGAASHSNKHA